MPRKFTAIQEPTPEESGGLSGRGILQVLKEHIEATQLPGFAEAVDAARKSGGEVSVSLRSFDQDRDLLYVCLVYAFFKGVRVMIEPEPFQGVRRKRQPAKETAPRNGP